MLQVLTRSEDVNVLDSRAMINKRAIEYSDLFVISLSICIVLLTTPYSMSLASTSSPAPRRLSLVCKGPNTTSLIQSFAPLQSHDPGPRLFHPDPPWRSALARSKPTGILKLIHNLRDFRYPTTITIQ